MDDIQAEFKYVWEVADHEVPVEVDSTMETQAALKKQALEKLQPVLDEMSEEERKSLGL